MKINEILSRLEGVRSTGNGRFMAKCPGHEDHTPSLSLSQDNGRVLLHCFAGCTTEKIVSAIGLNTSDLFTRPICDGVTISQLCQARCLNEQFVREFLKWKDVIYHRNGKPAISMPYFNENAVLFRSRLRLQLEKAKENDGRFIWANDGNGLMPYGLQYLSKCKDKGYVVWVEGETDCACLLQHGISSLGVPGAYTFNKHLEWRNYTKGIRNLVVKEPDKEEIVLLRR